MRLLQQRIQPVARVCRPQNQTWVLDRTSREILEGEIIMKTINLERYFPNLKQTINLHVSQIPEIATPEEITYRDEVGNEIIDMTFSGDGSRFIRAEIFTDRMSEDEPESEVRPLKLRDAVPMLQSIERHGDWWNPNTERYLGFWVQK